MKDIIINWLFDKKKKGYMFYIQEYPFNKTIKYFVSEKRLISLGLNQYNVINCIYDSYQSCEDVNFTISIVDNVINKD